MILACRKVALSFRAGKLLLVAFLFIVAFGIRLYHVNEPPLDFHATRQYRSLIIARGCFLDSSISVPEWEKQVAHTSQEKQGMLEPPIMELLVSAGYRMLGEENLWLARSATLIHLNGVLTGTFLVNEAEKTLLSQLWTTEFFWQGWLLNYNLATHDHYQLQLIPIVGLSMAPLVALILRRLRAVHPQFPWRIACYGTLAVAVLISIRIAGSRLGNPSSENMVRADEEIGEQVNHSTRTIFLSSDDGVPLEYHGLLSGLPWPLSSDLEWEQLDGMPAITAEERFNNYFAKYSPEYFIVEDFVQFDERPDLKQFLSRFPLVSENKDYLIFDLTGR